MARLRDRFRRHLRPLRPPHRAAGARVGAPAVLGVLTALGALSGCTAAEEAPTVSLPEQMHTEIVAVHPFDETSFTQGLEVDAEGNLLVSTGRKGESRVYRRDMDGRELQSVDLPAEFFGEGLTRSGSNLWQLTWRDGVAVRRDARTLQEQKRVPWSGEGWGICALDDQTLVASDGSAQVRLLDSRDLTELNRVTVGGDEPVAGLNELECVNGEVYANVFLSDRIVGFDPHTGVVSAEVDASGLPNNAEPDVDNVLNGIAHVPGTDRFLLAGKRWPDLYEVRFVPDA